ncbi:MAG: hypothetical protein AAFP89_14925 [Bacteroidota bacterium]
MKNLRLYLLLCLILGTWQFFEAQVSEPKTIGNVNIYYVEGFFTLQASHLVTSRIKGTEHYDFLVNAGVWDSIEETNYRVISSIQLGVGVFVDAD